MGESKSFSSVNTDTFVSLYSNSNLNSNGKNDYRDCWSNPDTVNSNSIGKSNEYNDCWSNPDLQGDEARSYAASASMPRSVLLFGGKLSTELNYDPADASFESCPCDNQFNGEPEPYNSTLDAREKSVRNADGSLSRNSSKPIIPPLPQLSLLNSNSPHEDIIGAAKQKLLQEKHANAQQELMKKERNDDTESMDFYSVQSAGSQRFTSRTPPDDGSGSYAIPIVTPSTPPLPDLTQRNDQPNKGQQAYDQYAVVKTPVIPSSSYFDFFNFSCCMKTPCTGEGWSCDPYLDKSQIPAPTSNELQYLRSSPRR